MQDLQPAPTPSGLRGRLRAVAIGGISFFVLLTAAVYVVAPSSPVLELSVQELSGPATYDEDITAEYSLAAATVAAKRTYKETIYGKVSSPSRIPVSRARLVIRGVSPKVRGQRATIAIGGPKTFRSIVGLRPGKYKLNFLLKADGRNRKSTTTRWVRNGRAYRVSVVVRESGIVTMLPISSY
jgi:hypothetical protein